MTWADDSYCIYRCTLPWIEETARTHRLGEWGEWTEIPFLFIPKRSYENEWLWGRGVQMRILPRGVSFTESTIDAEIMYDTNKNIFMRNLKGGAHG